ncbi:MAG: hypothetical protein Q4D12_11500, partial [Bacteroidales bacterium]|nr:hypothetical protein [Bacteroidales bacterium]
MRLRNRLLILICILSLVFGNMVFADADVVRGDLGSVTLNAEWDGTQIKDYFSISTKTTADATTAYLTYTDSSSSAPVQVSSQYYAKKGAAVTLSDTGTVDINRTWRAYGNSAKGGGDVQY